MKELEGYQLLSNAIIVRACDDYRDARTTVKNYAEGVVDKADHSRLAQVLKLALADRGIVADIDIHIKGVDLAMLKEKVAEEESLKNKIKKLEDEDKDKEHFFLSIPTLQALEKLNRADRTIKGILKFFKSDEFGMLTKANPEYLLRKLDEEFKSE